MATLGCTLIKVCCLYNPPDCSTGCREERGKACTACRTMRTKRRMSDIFVCDVAHAVAAVTAAASAATATTTNATVILQLLPELMPQGKQRNRRTLYELLPGT